MKSIFTILLTLMTINLLQAQSNDIKVSEQGLTFGDGTIVNEQVSNNEYPAGANYFFAEFSQGIEGDVVTSGFEDHVELYEVNHYLYKKTNNNGLPNGNSQNKYFSFKKKMDISTVPIMTIYKNGSNIDNIKIKIVIPNSTSGVLENAYTLELTNVRIVEYWIDFDIKTNNSKEIVEQYVVSYENFIIDDKIASTNVVIPYSY